MRARSDLTAAVAVMLIIAFAVIRYVMPDALGWLMIVGCVVWSMISVARVIVRRYAPSGPTS